MKYFFFLALLLLASASADAQRIRRLLIFTDDPQNETMLTQRQWLEAEKEGVEQRDIWIAVFHDPKTFRRMYEHYDVGRADFYLILLDKDGTEKIRTEELLPAKDLFQLIDGEVVQKGGG